MKSFNRISWKRLLYEAVQSWSEEPSTSVLQWKIVLGSAMQAHLNKAVFTFSTEKDHPQGGGAPTRKLKTLQVSKAEKTRIIMEAVKKAQKRHVSCNQDTLRKQKRIESVVRPPRIPQNDELDGNAEYGSQRHVELKNILPTL